MEPVIEAGMSRQMVKVTISFLVVMQVGVEALQRTSSASASHARLANTLRGALARESRPAAWFQAFSEAESTEDADGIYNDKNPFLYVLDGWAPNQHSPANPLAPDMLKPKWYEESPSAGQYQAWQTFYPNLKEGIAGRGAHPGSWFESATGEWVQNYNRADTNRFQRVGATPADWFDSSVNNIDGFGRVKSPGPASWRNYYAPAWQERAVNTTLRCPDSGCTARSSLQAYDPFTEVAKNCRLSIAVHPTDFDDDWSLESIEYWNANGKVLMRDCWPQARGCNASAWMPLFSCLNSFAVDTVINDVGALNIEGKITDMVDECPDNGYLLNAVATVTCMVQPLNVTTPGPPGGPPAGPNGTVPAMSWQDMLNQAIADYYANGGDPTLGPYGIPWDMLMSGQYPFAAIPFYCNTPGCTAPAMLFFDPDVALQGGTCKMEINVTQTDYDEENGSVEMIEYINVQGLNVTTDLKPGLNPCLNQMEGAPFDPDRNFPVVADQDVTQQILDSPSPGMLMIKAKNSQKVDECGYMGQLLYGIAFLNCTA